MHILGTTTVIRQDGLVLMTRRSDVGAWVLPGGHLDSGETIEQGCIREVHEETGLEVEFERLTGIYQKPARQAFVFAFRCRVTGGRLQPTREAAEHRAFALDDLPELLLPKHRECIADAAAGRVEAVLKMQDIPPGLEVLGLR